MACSELFQHCFLPPPLLHLLQHLLCWNRAELWVRGGKLRDLTLKSLLGFLSAEEIEEFLSFVAMALGGGWSCDEQQIRELSAATPAPTSFRSGTVVN